MRRTMLLFVASQLTFGYATGIFDMLYNLHVKQLGIGSSWIGFIQFVGLAVMAVVCVLPVLTNGNGVRQRRIMVLSALGFGATLLLTAVATTFWTQLVALSLCTACTGTAMATVTAVMGANARSDSQLFTAMQWGFVSFLLGQGVANLTGGWLSLHTAHGSTQFQLALGVAGVLGIVTGLLRTGIRAADHGPAQVDGGDAAAATGRNSLSRSFIVKIVVLAVLIGAFSALALRLFNLVLVEHYDVSVIGLGYFLALDRVVSAAGIFAFYPLLRLLGTVRAAGLLLLCVLPLQLVSTFTGSVLLLMVPHLLRQGIYYSQMPVLDLVTNSDVSDNRKAMSNGIQKFGFFAGSGVAAQLYAALLDHEQTGLALAISGGFAALAGVVYLTGFGPTRSVRGPVHESAEVGPAGRSVRTAQ